jgi:hypothetical protein
VRKGAQTSLNKLAGDLVGQTQSAPAASGAGCGCGKSRAIARPIPNCGERT